MTDLLVYIGLFATALLAATIVPAQSEAALAALLVAGQQPPWALIAVASVGNVLGSTINWLLGRGIERFRHARWFPASEAQLARAQGWYRRWGKWSLLASWVPVIGDPLTLAAGLMREPLPVFLLLVTIAKVGRYLVLAAIVMGWMISTSP
jgi:membrane protein YqaA with SNARE-associated domain